MSDAARALVGKQHRRARTPGYGVPAIPEPRPADEVTNPFDMLERALTSTGIEVIRRSKRDSKDPALFEDIVKLAGELHKERSETREREEQYAAVLRSPHEAATHLVARITVVEGVLKSARRLAITAIVALGGVVGTFATGLLNRHDEATAERIHNEQLRKDVDRLDNELRDMRIQLGRSSLNRTTSAITAEKGTVQ